MGLESREWSSERRARRSGGVSLPMGALIVLGVVGGLLLVGVLTSRAQPSEDYGGTLYTHAEATKISLLPGLPSISVGGDGLYAKDDPWAVYLADEETCPGGERSDRPLGEQADTMVCLVNYARRKRGLNGVTTVAFLSRASLAKAERITRCLDFNHDACGTDAASDVRSLGYRGAWGENLFIAGGRYGAPRPALDGWLNSPKHRENLFRPEWRLQGLAVQKIERFGNDRNMTLWVNQFGDG
jgi:uncharacterized protein YkwD